MATPSPSRGSLAATPVDLKTSRSGTPRQDFIFGIFDSRGNLVPKTRISAEPTVIMPGGSFKSFKLSDGKNGKTPLTPLLESPTSASISPTSAMIACALADMNQESVTFNLQRSPTPDENCSFDCDSPIIFSPLPGIIPVTLRELDINLKIIEEIKAKNLPEDEMHEQIANAIYNRTLITNEVEGTLSGFAKAYSLKITDDLKNLLNTYLDQQELTPKNVSDKVNKFLRTTFIEAEAASERKFFESRYGIEVPWATAVELAFHLIRQKDLNLNEVGLAAHKFLEKKILSKPNMEHGNEK